MSNWLRLLNHLLELQSNINKPSTALDEYVNKKLRYIVKYSYENVPFYNRLLKESKVDPSQIKNKSDLSKISFINKSILKNNPLKDLLSTEFVDTKLNVVKSGGSTGEPFSTYITDSEKERRLAVQLRAFLRTGQRFYNRWASLEAFTDYSKHRTSSFIFPQIHVPLMWDTERKIDALKSFDPYVLDGLSSSIWTLARYVNENKVRGVSPKLVFGTGELISPVFRQEINKAFNADYFDHVSCTEVGRTAWECKAHIGYHMNIDTTITQFVDDEGEEVAPGERGEIVYTSLDNYAMPLLRYKIQDIGIPIDDECTCGVNLPMMKMIEGRHNSFIVLPNGLVISPWKFIESIKLYLLTDEINQYKVIQQRHDLIEIQIVKTNSQVDEEKIRNWVIQNIKDSFRENEINLSDIELKIVFKDSIPIAPSGKLNVVTSNLKDIPVL